MVVADFAKVCLVQHKFTQPSASWPRPRLRVLYRGIDNLLWPHGLTCGS